MSYRLPFLLVASMVAVSCVEGSQPNVIVIHADDLGWADLGCYGSEFYETPNLDRFAESGARFTNAYATCPVCSPSRASLMTGKYPARLGMTAHVGDAQPDQWKRDTPLKPASYVSDLPLEETTLAEAFHAAGYATLHVGKWHLGGERHWPEYHGFDVNVGGWSNGGPFGGGKYFSPYANPRLRNGPPGEYLAERLSEEVASFIDAHHHEPFFIHYAPYLVHVPLQGREELVAKYESKLRSLPSLDSEWIKTPDGKVRVRQDLPVYAAMVEALDSAVGRVLDKLEQTKLSGNTIVVFTSDNGGLATGDVAISEAEGWPTTNHPLRAGKGWLYEGGIREPLLVRVPGVTEPGSESDYIVTGTDYYPTLLQLAGIDSPERSSVDGKSFASALSGRHDERGPVYWHYPHYGNQGGRPGSAIRDGQWKLIEWFTASGESELELYNLSEDLGETRNLEATHPDKRDELLDLLVAWRKSVGARLPTPNYDDSSSTPVANREAIHGQRDGMGSTTLRD